MDDTEFMDYVATKVSDGLEPLLGTGVGKDIRTSNQEPPYAGKTAHLVLSYNRFTGDRIDWGAARSIAAPSKHDVGKLAETVRYIEYEGIVPLGENVQSVTRQSVKYVFDTSDLVVRVEAPKQDAASGIASHLGIGVGRTLDDTIAATIDYASSQRIPSNLID